MWALRYRQYACYEYVWSVQCAYTGVVSKNISSRYPSLGPKHMRISDNAHERNEFIFATLRKKQQKENKNASKQRKKKLPTIKKMMHSDSALLLNPHNQNVCATSFDVMDFSVLAHFIFVHIIIIVSQLHLFTPIYASWFILFMHFSLSLNEENTANNNTNSNSMKRAKISLILRSFAI